MKRAWLPFVAFGWLFLPMAARAQDSAIIDVVRANLQQRANGMLSLMGYSQTPDVTSGSLAIKDHGTNDPSFDNTSIGAGFTVSDSVPIYLEGTLGHARYNPRFTASEGESTLLLPTSWDSEIATVGVGWDFHLTDNLVFRPIANGSYGRVESEVKVPSTAVAVQNTQQVDFLVHGRLDASGIGGSLMLDYEHYVETHEVDVELRYTNIRMHSTNDSSPPVRGSSRNENVGLWGRWRAPTGWEAMDRPVRYVLEFAHTTYFGQDATVLGFNHLTSLGAGLELDASKYRPLWIDRARAVVRYVFGQNVKGVSVGLAVTFD